MGPAATSASHATTEIVWTNLPASWGVFVFLAVVAGIVYASLALYRRETELRTSSIRLLLVTLRASALLLLAAIFLGPSSVLVEERTLQPNLLLLRDASQSMSTADVLVPRSVSADGHQTRAQLVDQLLSRNQQQVLRQLEKKGRLEVADFSDHVTPVEYGPGKALPPLEPSGRNTDLAGALHQVMTQSRVAAIVVFSDGQHTGPQSVDPAAREAAEKKIPLFFIGIGDPDRHENIRVASVYARPQAWQDEPFEIEAVITHDSGQSREIKVQLLEKKSPDNSKESGAGLAIETRTIELRAGGGQQTVRFERTVNDPGEFVYEVRVLNDGGMDNPADHAASSSVVNVLSREQVRVLLVAGSPTWDYQLVEKLLVRDKTLTVSCWLQTLDAGRAQEGSSPISQLPTKREELFLYDAVLLFDPNPNEFDGQWIDLLRAFVSEHAGGLLYMAGPKFTSQFLTGTRTQALTELLPVSFGDLQAGEIASLLSTSNRAWPLQVVAASADHPLLRFGADATESRRLWDALPGVFWSFPSHAPKPTAEVLLEHSDPTLRGSRGARPMLVAGRYGAGHTLYMGFADTWRWRKGGRQAEIFDKYWIQTVRYLAAGRSLAGQRRGTLESDREHYELGEPITLRARLVTPTFEPLTAESVPATVGVPGESTESINLTRIADQPGRYEGTWTPRKPGTYRAKIELAGHDPGATPVTIATSLRVDLPGREMSQVWMNRPLLRELASLSGGKYFDADQTDELAAAIPDRTETVASKSPPRPLWDTGGMLTVLVGLLCTEWLLRKSFRLL